MTNEEKQAAALQVQAAVVDALMPLMAVDGKPGMFGVQVFFLMRQADGTASSCVTGAGETDGEVRRMLDITVARHVLGEGYDYSAAGLIGKPKKN